MNEFSKQNLQIAVERIFNSGPDDLSYNDAALAISRIASTSADQKLSLESISESHPRLWKYLLTDSDAMGELKLYLELLNQEKDAETVANIRVPKRPDQATIAQRIGQFVESLVQFPGFPTVALAPTRGEQLNLGQVEIDLNLDFTLEIDPAIHSDDPEKRDIFLTLNPQDGEVEESELEGISVELLLAGSNQEVGRADFDDLGDAAIRGLEQGIAYDIRVSLEAEIVRVRELILPASSA